MRILGVDPGKDVALCLLSDTDAPVARKIVSPGKGVSEEALHAAIVELRPDVAYVELVGVMPGQGAVSGATFMVAWGIIRGLLRGCGVRYVLVTPQKWKASILAGYDMGPEIPKGLDRKGRAKLVTQRKAAQKAAAIAEVGKRYPEIPLILPRCRVADHNIAESVCLAMYGQEAERGR